MHDTFKESTNLALLALITVTGACGALRPLGPLNRAATLQTIGILRYL